MRSINQVVLALLILHIAVAVKVKVLMQSDQEDSKMDDEDIAHTEAWDIKKISDATKLPFIKKARKHVEEKLEFEDEKSTTQKSRPLHPNELLFPLIYKQNHVNSMFKFSGNWYTWSTEKRTDGSKATNYYICYEEPKRCDDVGWERIDSLPKCAFQIDSLMPEDRACINSFGVEPRSNGMCDGAEQMKVSEMLRTCGPRIKSLWRFFRVGHRPANIAKPADVNSLICEDEEECYITIEYRIHHDRITFSLHEPTRGQTFKSALKRELPNEDENKVAITEAHHPRSMRRNKKARDDDKKKKFHARSKGKPAEGKGVVKERSDDSTYGSRKILKNKIKNREDVSADDVSE